MAGLTESGHRSTVQLERFRVVCDECPWFKYEPGASASRLREYGYGHKNATKIR